jgi:ATP-dependent helicase/nuclease subunit B
MANQQGNVDKIKKIHIKVGVKADGPVPEQVTDALGRITVGPQGLLNLLETQLGIPSAEVSFTTRLIQYLACIDQSNQEDRFYHESYKADPFSVARTILQWRDQWYLAGWQGTFENDVPAKLADMAAIEQHALQSVEACTGQRIQSIIQLLIDNPIAIATIELLDGLDHFPDHWQRLIHAIGVPIIEPVAITPQAAEDSDLFKLQRHLLEGSIEPLQLENDGSILILQADSALESAPVIARFSQKALSTFPDQTLAILAEVRGDLLDESLEAAGAPRLGFTALSPWRPVFQVLPLACELLWAPLNPTALFQFLSHSMGPIPARHRKNLAQTVAQMPGIGSAEWEAAIEASLEAETSEAARRRFEDNIRYWLESPRFDPHKGVDSNTVLERAIRVANWLQGARDATDKPAMKSLYYIALNQTLEFVQAVERLRIHGRETLTRDNVLRLIEDVRGTGAAVPDRSAEVHPNQPLTLRSEHSGAFNKPLDQIIWWDCQASDHVQRWPWSRTERAALAENGVLLQSEDEQLRWLGKAWLRPILCAKQQFTFVLHADVERHHPVWDLVVSLTSGLTITSVADTQALGISHTQLEPRTLPPRQRWWQLPEDTILPRREFESYSSLDTYINSPYQWLLRYAARIRPGSLTTVNDGNLLKGSLAHRIYEEYLNDHCEISTIDPSLIEPWIDQHAPSLIEKEGALLLEPGRQAEYEGFIADLQYSLKVLIEHLQQARVVKVSMELQQEGNYTGGKLTGSIDLLATREDGQEAVVDIKWGGKSYRRESLRDSSYLQLATYAQLRRGGGAMPKLGYFIVSGAHMLSLDHDFFPQAECIIPENQENWTQLWQRFEHTWRWRKEQFDKGQIEVTITGIEPSEDSQPGEDGLDIPDCSDMYNDYKVVTGWEPNS